MAVINGLMDRSPAAPQFGDQAALQAEQRRIGSDPVARRPRGSIGGPTVKGAPDRTRTWWPSLKASSGSWVTRTTVRPASRRAARSCNSSRVTASRWANGSSISTTARSSQSVRASAARWRMPADSVSGRSFNLWPDRPRRAGRGRAVRRPRSAGVAAQAIAEQDVVEDGEPGQQQIATGPCRRRGCSACGRRAEGRPASAAARSCRRRCGPAGRSSGRPGNSSVRSSGNDAIAEGDARAAHERGGAATTNVTSPYAGTNRIRLPGSFFRTSQPRCGSPR